MRLLEGVGIAGPDAFIRTGDAIERQEIVPILPISIDAYTVRGDVVEQHGRLRCAAVEEVVKMRDLRRHYAAIWATNTL